MTVLAGAAPAVLKTYYRILSGGIDRYGSGEELMPLLLADSTSRARSPDAK